MKYQICKKTMWIKRVFLARMTRVRYNETSAFGQARNYDPKGDSDNGKKECMGSV